ncbi:unnamed protein product, partial [Effrenium voratum]
RRQQQYLQDFLRRHRCEHVSEPQLASGCLRVAFKEELYPIHVAAQLGDAKAIRLLLAEGADPFQPTSRGRTALDIARQHAHPEVQELLEHP